MPGSITEKVIESFILIRILKYLTNQMNILRSKYMLYVKQENFKNWMNMFILLEK